MALRAIEVMKSDVKDSHEAGPAPILQWLDISDLVVDEQYQRELTRSSWAAIRAIAAGFRWAMFSPVFVAPIEGGKYAIIDGQHRTHAAALCGFKQVPCQIVQMTRTDQAAAFAAVNGKVTKITSWQVYRAALAAGERWAVDADRAATAGGARLMQGNASASAKNAGEIYAVKTFCAVLERKGQEAVSAVLRFLLSCDEWKIEPLYWDAGIVFPVMTALCDRLHLLDRSEFHEAFEGFNVWKLVEEVDRETKDRRRSGEKVGAKTDLLRIKVIHWVDGRLIPARKAETF